MSGGKQVGTFQEEGSGDSHYVSWQPKGAQVSLSPAMCSTYKAVQGQGAHPYRQTCAAMGVREGVPLRLALARAPELKGAATTGHPDTQASLVHTSVARQPGRHPSPLASFSFTGQAPGCDIIATA